MANALSVPSSALIFDANGLSIATVDANDHVVVKSVSILRDLGAVVEISSGLDAKDRVIQNPPDGIGTGEPVHVIGDPRGRRGRRCGEEQERSWLARCPERVFGKLSRPATARNRWVRLGEAFGEGPPPADSCAENTAL